MLQALEKTLRLTTGLFLALVVISRDVPPTTTRLESQRQLLVTLEPSLEHSSSGKRPLSKLLAKAALQPPHSLQGFPCKTPTLTLLLLVPRLPGNVVCPFCRARWELEETAVVKAPSHLCEGWDRAAAGHRE